MVNKRDEGCELGGRRGREGDKEVEMMEEGREGDDEVREGDNDVYK